MNITIGQYYPTDSIIHNIDPRIKIFSLFVYIVSVFCDNSFFAYFAAFIFIAVVTVISKVPVSMMLKGLKALWFVVLFTAFFNVCFGTDGESLFSFGIINITRYSIISAIKIIIRLVLIVVSSALLTLTTPPIELTYAAESLMKPLKVFHFPAHEIAVMMSIALRFIPTLADEADRIKKAQIARGADLESGNIAERAKKLLPILIPLFVSSMRRAEELAEAMDARCYRGDINRTKMNVRKLEKKDIAAMTVTIVYFAAVTAVVIFRNMFFTAIL